MSVSYPAGNFGGNRLLDDLISLSPLYPSAMIDLHARIAMDLHQGFPLTLSYSGIVHHLSDPNVYALAPPH